MKQKHDASYILVAYRIVGGWHRNWTVLEHSNSKERLEYLVDSTRYDDYKKDGYIIAIYQEA